LFFVPQQHELLPRTAWQSVRDRGVFYTPGFGDEITWAIEQIASFLHREQSRGTDNAVWLRQDSNARTRLNSRPGLVKRIKALHPTAGPF